MGNPAGDGGAGYNIVTPIGSELVRLIPQGQPPGVAATNADYFALVSSIAALVPFGLTTETNAVATGTNQMTAKQISKNITIFTNVGAGTGAVLPNFASNFVGFFGWVVVKNGQSNMDLYPYGSGSINAGAPGAPVVVPAGTSGLIFVNGPGDIYIR